MTQHGCDSHRDDPLADLMLSVDGQRASYLALRPAHEICDGKWVVTGGGGYALVEVVPGLDPPAVRGRRPPDRRVDVDARGLARTSASASAGPRRTALTDGRDPAYRDWSEATTPVPGWTGRSMRPGREIFPFTASTRFPDRNEG